MSTVGILVLSLFCLTYISASRAMKDVDIRELKGLMRSIGTSFVHEKSLVTEKGEDYKTCALHISFIVTGYYFAK